MVSQKQIQHRCRLLKSQRAFTLVEVMMGAIVFTIVVLGLMASFMLAYRLSLTARYQDRALNTVMAVVDQFQNAPTYDKSSGTLKTLFGVHGASGNGMAWDTMQQCFVYPTTTLPANVVSGDGQPDLEIPLSAAGDGASPITLKLTCAVTAVTTPGFTPDPAAGTLVQGTFEATYTLFNKTNKLQFKVLRNLNPSDRS